MTAELVVDRRLLRARHAACVCCDCIRLNDVLRTVRRYYAKNASHPAAAFDVAGMRQQRSDLV
jgi:hypothetical protein